MKPTKVFDYETYFKPKYRPHSRTKTTEFEEFVLSLDYGEAAEFHIPEGVKRESARTFLLTVAKKMGKKIEVSSRCPEGFLLVGVPPRAA
jgi:hypothetical protein